jgi:dihydroxyacetone kinase
MKKFINSVDGVLAESLDGLAAAHADLVALGPERKFVRRRELNPKKVALVSGGGSGHEPLHAGFVGYGMSMPPVRDRSSRRRRRTRSLRPRRLFPPRPVCCSS